MILGLLVRHIAIHSGGDVAERFGVKLIQKALTLATLPERGRVVPEVGLPYREIIFRSYRIVYMLEKELVQVIRFWHAARGTPQIDSDNFGNGNGDIGL